MAINALTALFLFGAIMIFALPCIIAGHIMGRMTQWATQKRR